MTGGLELGRGVVPDTAEAGLLVDMLVLLGVIVVLRWTALPILRAVSAFLAYFVRPGKNLKRLGGWAGECVCLQSHLWLD